MASLPTQFDLLPGVALSAIASPTKVQLEQAIAQAAPYSTVGFLVVTNGGSFFPDVTNNPRYARYIWLDTSTNPPTAKLYDPTLGSGNDPSHWVPFGLADDAVIADYIKPGGSAIYDNDGTTPKVAVQAPVGAAPPSAIVGKANWIARADGSGQYIELVALSTILSSGTVPTSAIVAGTNGQFLKTSAGAAGWATFNPATDIAADSIDFAKLSASGLTDGWILVAASGVMTAVSNNDLTSNFLPATSVHLNKLSQSGAATNQGIKWNGTNWVPTGDGLVNLHEETDTSKYLLGSGLQTFNFEHSFGTVPKLVRLVAVVQSTIAGWAVGDELAVDQCFSSGDPEDSVLGFGADDQFVYAVQRDDLKVVHKTTGVPTVIPGNELRLKCYAWA